MKLKQSELANNNLWKSLSYDLPQYDRDIVAKQTKQSPFWIHFGAGNIFRAFQANVVQNLLNKGLLDKGLIVAEGYDYEIIKKINHPYDDLSILVTLKANGDISRTVIGSVVESLTLDSANQLDYSRLKEIFQADSLQMATFTITEKGYSLVDGTKKPLPLVTKDMNQGPTAPESYIGKVASLLYARFQNKKQPIAMVSMDNCSHNGDKLYHAMISFAQAWEENGLVENGFYDYVNDPKTVSFPCTMIDKITPRPDSFVCDLLKKDGLEDIDPIVTSKNTYVAPFVNAEECEYLVIEDQFPNGRPSLEEGGFIFTTRDIVDKVERMKVCTCLNPLHTTLAIFGCLLGYDLISKEMANPVLKNLVELIGYKEGLPVVVNPGILDPKEFIDTVINIRIPNPFMPDTPQRIATDTSQKLAIRFGETIKAYEASSTLNVSDLTYIPLVFAGWLRYLMAIDDNGNSFELSPDPLLTQVCSYVKEIKLGDKINAYEDLKPLLEDASIFGVNLYQVGLAELVCDYFTEMIAGTGAIASTLAKYVTKEK